MRDLRTSSSSHGWEMITTMADTRLFYYEKQRVTCRPAFADLGVWVGERIEADRREKVWLRFSTNVNAKRIPTGQKGRKRCPCYLFNTRMGQTPQTPLYPSLRATSPSLLAYVGNASTNTSCSLRHPPVGSSLKFQLRTRLDRSNSNTTRNFSSVAAGTTPAPMTYEHLLPSLIANHLSGTSLPVSNPFS